MNANGFAFCQFQVRAFNDKFGLLKAVDGPGFFDEKAMHARISKIMEEHDELLEAVDNRDLVETVDACIDLIYVTMGFLSQLNVHGEPVWDAVCRANLTKQPGPNHSVIKPTGFVKPDVRAILKSQGWSGV